MVPPPPSYQRRRQRRHHHPLQTATTVAAAAAAAYGTYRLASWAWDTFRGDADHHRPHPDDEQAAAACVENSASAGGAGRRQRQQHQSSQHGNGASSAGGAPSSPSQSTQKRRRHALVRQHRLTRCRSETTAALSDFLPTLRQTVERCTDFGQETAELKRIRTARGDRMRRRMEGAEGAEVVVAVGGNDAKDDVDADNADGGNTCTTGEDERNTGDKNNNTNNDDDDEEEEKEEHAERKREAELWDTIKVRSLSRLLVTAYGHSLLLLVLTVQVHLLGGRLFREEEEEVDEAEAVESRKTDEVEITTHTSAANAGNADGMSTTSSLGLHSRTGTGTGTGGGEVGPRSRSSRTSSSAMPSYQSTHRTVLTQTYGHFFADGLADLLAAVEEAVRNVFAEYDVTDPDTMHVAAEDFDAAMDDVRAMVEGGSSSGLGGGMLRSALVQYIVQPEGGTVAAAEADTTDPIAAHILEETWDVLESPTFAAAERDVLDLTFGMLREGGWGGIFPPMAMMEMGDATMPSPPPHSPQARGGESTRPLAQIVTQLRRTTNTFYANVGNDDNHAGGGEAYYDSHPPNVYLPAVDRLPALLELGDVGFN